MYTINACVPVTLVQNCAENNAAVLLLVLLNNLRKHKKGMECRAFVVDTFHETGANTANMGGRCSL